MICVETEAERDSRGWNGLDGDVERRDVDEGEPGNRMEVGEDWLTRAVGMVENEGGGDVVVGHAGGRGRGGQTGGGCGTNAGAEQTHTKGDLRIRAGGLDRAKGRVSIRNVERTTASGTTGGVAGAVVPDEGGGPILVVEGYSVSGDEDGRESDDVRDDVQSGDGGGDGVADTGIARGCEREETTCGGGGTAPGARCGSMDETLTKTARGACEAAAGAGATGRGERDGDGDREREPNAETEAGRAAGDVGAGGPVDGGAV